MSKEIQNTKSVIARLRSLTKKLSPEERQYLIAKEQFLRLPMKQKQKYLAIYNSYTEDEKTEVQVAEELGISLSAVRNALRLIGDQLIVFAKSRTVLVPQLEKLRRRKQRLIKDTEEMDFVKKTDKGEKIIMAGIADLKRRYYVEIRKIEEMENSILGLLNTNVVIDKSSKQVNFVSNYDRPEHEVPTSDGKVVDADFEDVGSVDANT